MVRRTWKAGVVQVTDSGDKLTEASLVNQLREPLGPLQAALLKRVWEPIQNDGWTRTGQEWPTWDYVARSLYREHQELEDAVALLASLPTVPPKLVNSQRYGLTWHTGHSALPPGPEDRVGLTVPGLLAIAAPDSSTAFIANELALLIRELAGREASLPLDPNAVAKLDVDLASLIGSLTEQTRRKPLILTEPVIAGILQHEYAPLQVYESETQHFSVKLGRISLRAFRTISSADTYLELIGQDLDARLVDEPWTSPLTLAQTLDYLGYVLYADATWDDEDRLTQAPDLQSAAALTAEVATGPEYQTALSGLWNVISQLHVPQVPKQVADGRFNGTQPGSIARLEFWLEGRLQGDQAAVTRVNQALTIIRAVGRMRAESQHASTTTRAEGAQARAKLGLPEFIHDFRGALQTVRGRLAGAFDVIRQEVQAAPPSPAAANE